MHRLTGALVAAFLWSAAAGAQAQDSIQDVIGQQLQAFNERDVDRAFGFASPMIKRLFGTPDNFGTMVARGYPMVWDNREVRFLETFQEGQGQFQKVLLRGPKGQLHLLLYKMIQTPSGWQIDGVEFLEMTDLGV